MAVKFTVASGQSFQLIVLQDGDKKELLVIELKRGRASDRVVGQIQRYMGYVISDVAEADQTVKGAIVALKDDLKIRRALSVTNNIEFFKYKVDFELSRIT